MATARLTLHVPIWVPSAEQTLWPAVVHEAEEAAGVEEGIVGATEGAAAGAAVTDGATTATFSWMPTFCTASAAGSGVADGEGCAAGDGALGCAVAPPGTVQPMGVHSIPCTLPSPFGAIT